MSMPRNFESYLTDDNRVHLSAEDASRLLNIGDDWPAPEKAMALFDDATDRLKEVRGYVIISNGKRRQARRKVSKGGGWTLDYGAVQ